MVALGRSTSLPTTKGEEGGQNSWSVTTNSVKPGVRKSHFLERQIDFSPKVAKKWSNSKLSNSVQFTLNSTCLSGFSPVCVGGQREPQTFAFSFQRQAAFRFSLVPPPSSLSCAASRLQALLDRNGCLGRRGEGVSNEQEHRCRSRREGSWCMVKCQVRTMPPSTRESFLNL